MKDICIRSGFDNLWCMMHGAEFPRGVRECRGVPRVYEVPVQRVTRPVEPCPCECNSGGFCGGCGHAGCSGGINLR